MTQKPRHPSRTPGKSVPKPAHKAAGRPAQTGPIRRPAKLPFLDAVCKKLNQRINVEDEQRVLGLYERGWILRGALGNLDGDEARYVRALANRYNSWIARQVA